MQHEQHGTARFIVFSAVSTTTILLLELTHPLDAQSL
jgi:hypothetical protein